MSSAITCAAMSSGRTSESPPPRFPTAVRTPSTMKACPTRLPMSSPATERKRGGGGSVFDVYSQMRFLRLVDRALERRDGLTLLIGYSDSKERQSLRRRHQLGNSGNDVPSIDRCRIRDAIVDRDRHVAVGVRSESQ